MNTLPSTHPPLAPPALAPSAARRAFTLIEVLVVISIIVILLAVSIPTIRALTNGNKQAQSVNLIRAFLANARSVAISQHRQAGVVFFEESSKYTASPHGGVTALQLVIADANQAQYNPAAGNTVFIYYNTERQYLPGGMAVATLNDDPTEQILTADNTGATTRVIIFNESGQMITRTGVARPDLSGSNTTYPEMYGDWNFTTKRGTPSNGVSSPGVLVFDLNDYKAQTFASDTNRSTWLQQHANVLIVNPYTGSLIQ